MGGLGKSSSTQRAEPNAYEQQMAAISSDLYGSTAGLRQAILQQLNSYMGVPPAGSSPGTVASDADLAALYKEATTPIQTGGGQTTGWGGEYTTTPATYGPNQAAIDKYAAAVAAKNAAGNAVSATPAGELPFQLNPVYNAGRRGLEDQYAIAKQNILATMPPGGSRDTALASLEMQRAESVGALKSAIGEDLYNKSYGLATGAPQQSMAGIGSVAGTFGSRQGMAMAANAQQAAAAQQALGGLGKGLGYMLASGKKNNQGGSGSGGMIGLIGTALNKLWGNGGAGGGASGYTDTTSGLWNAGTSYEGEMGNMGQYYNGVPSNLAYYDTAAPIDWEVPAEMM